MMTHLTGSPRIGGAPWPHQAEVESRAVPLAVVREGARGAEAVVDLAFRVEARIVWAALTAPEARALQEALAGAVSVEVRSAAAGDPGWAEPLALEMVVVSDAVLTGPVSRRDGGGAVRYVVEVELESLREDLTPEALGLTVGAFVLLSTAEHYHEFGTEDGATIEPLAEQTVTLEDGTVLTIGGWELGDARTAAARVSEGGPHHYDIHTREALQGGPVII